MEDSCSVESSMETDRLFDRIYSEYYQYNSQTATLSAQNRNLTKRRKQNRAVCIILLTSCIIKYAYYAIYGNLFDFLHASRKDAYDISYSSFMAVCINLVLIGSFSVLTIFGGVLGEAILNFYRIICCGLVLQLVGAIFFVALSFTPHPKEHGFHLFFTALGFEAASTSFTQASIAILGGEQIKERGHSAVHKYFEVFLWLNHISSFVAILVTDILFGDKHASTEVKSLRILSIIEISVTTVCIPVFISGKLTYTIPIKNASALISVFCARRVQLLRHLWHLCLVFSLVLTAQILQSQIDSTYAAQGLNLNCPSNISVGLARLSYDTAIVVCLPIMWLFQCICNSKGHSVKPINRMSIGLMISIIGVASAGILECVRYIRLQNGKPPPSIMWQIPQYFLQGIAELFISVTAYFFAFMESPSGLSGLVMGLLFATRGLGTYIAVLLAYIANKSSIYPTHLKKGHLGIYLFLLTAIGGVFLIIFTLCSKRFIPAKYKDLGEYDVFSVNVEEDHETENIQSSLEGNVDQS